MKGEPDLPVVLSNLPFFTVLKTNKQTILLVSDNTLTLFSNKFCENLRDLCGIKKKNQPKNENKYSLKSITVGR